MSDCPFCQTTLDASAEVNGRCTTCGGLLSQVDDTAQDRELVASVSAVAEASSDSDPTKTVVLAAEEEPAGSRDGDPQDPDAVPSNTAAGSPDTSEDLDSSSLSPDQSEHMRTLWEGAIGPFSAPGMSLKPQEITVSPESTLSIRSCALHTTSEVPADGTDYELLERVGEGGMGVVYAARQASMDRVVAVKMLRGEIASDSSQRDKFLSEAVVTAELDHPNIVPIHDLGTNESGALFYSMKHIQGIPWSQVIRQRSLAENLDILLKVCDAIAFAHTRGIVHRDLKPENVMLGDFGEVLVMDWGLAQTTHAFRRAEKVPVTVGLGGTPAYMAPEMAKGRTAEIGQPSDIYLLGATLFEIIAGKPPHAGKDTMACLYAAAANKIEPTDRSGELLDIALRAMETKTSARYSSVQDFQAAIRDYQSHAESITLAERASDELQKASETLEYQDFAEALYGYKEALTLWPENERARVGLTAAQLAYAQRAADREDFDLASSLLDDSSSSHVALAKHIASCRRDRDSRQRRLQTSKRLALTLTGVVMLTVFVAFFWIRADRNRARRAQLEAIKQRELADANAAEVTRQAALTEKNAQRARESAARAKTEKEAKEYESYVAQIGLAAEKIEENAFREARQLVRESASSPYKHWEWGRLKYLCREFATQFQSGGRIDAVAFHPQGQQLAAAGRNGRAYLWHVHQPSDPTILDHAGQFVHAVAFSPDGGLLATGSSDGRLRLFDATSGALLLEHQAHGDSILCLDFSADGGWLLTGSYDHTVCLWKRMGVDALEHQQTLRDHTWWIWDCSFSPDGNRILTTSHDGKATVWSRQSADSPDDRRYAKFTEFTGHTGPVYCGEFYTDGRHVVTGGHDKRLLVWDCEQVQPLDVRKFVTGEQVARPSFRALDGHTAPIRCIAVSSDGTRIASGGMDNALKIWDATTGHLLKTLRGHERELRACVFSPQGSLILSGSHDQTARLWDIGNYREVHLLRTRTLDDHTDGVLSASFNTRGTQVVTSGRDRTAKIWDVSEGKLLHDLKEGHDFLVSSVAFFPDGKRMLTGGGDSTVRIWSLASGTEQMRIDGTGWNGALALARDGHHVLTGHGHRARWTELAGGKLVHEIADHDANITAVATSHDGRLLFTADATGHVALWDSETGRKIWMTRVHSAAVTAASFQPGDHRILTASADHTVTQLDVRDGEEISGAVLKHPDSVHSLATSADGLHAISSCEDGVVRLWDLEKGTSREVEVAPQPETLANNLRRLMRSGQWKAASLAEQSGMSTERLSDLLEEGQPATEHELSLLAETLHVPVSKLRNPKVSSVAMTRDGKFALVIVSSARSLHLVDLGAAKEIFHPAHPNEQKPFLRLKSDNDLLWSAEFTPDGDRIVTLGGNDVRLWNVHTAEEQMSFSPHGTVASANFSPSGTSIVTASWDNSAKIWDVATGRARAKLIGHEGNVNAALFSPDGLHVLTASDDGTARLWDAQGGNADLLSYRGHSGPVLDATISADGRWVLTGSGDGTARIWDRRQGTQLRVLHDDSLTQLDADQPTAMSHPAGVRSVHFFHRDDVQLVVTGGEDGTAKIWDADSGLLLMTLEGHMSAVTSVAPSFDGKRLVTGSQDASAKIWDTQTGKEVLTLKGHQQEVTSVAFSPDGRFVLTSSRDGLATLWPAEEYATAPAAPAPTR